MTEDLNSSRGLEPASEAGHGAPPMPSTEAELAAACDRIARRIETYRTPGIASPGGVICSVKDLEIVLDALEHTQRDLRHFQYDTDVIEGSYIAALKEADDFISSEFENLTSGFTDREDAAQVLSTIRALLPTKVDLGTSTASPA